MKPIEETDTFQYESCYSFVAKRQRIVWGYKDKKDIVHSGVVDSLDEALEKAKKFGYQSNETVESKPQHDSVEKSDTHFIKNMKPPEERDTFQHEPYYSFLAKRPRIIWDYKDKKGILHSGVVDSLDEALEKAKRFGYSKQKDSTWIKKWWLAVRN